MTELMLEIDTVAAAAMATVCGWAVMSPRVRDGVVIKMGLILMSLGLMLVSFALADGAMCDTSHTFASAGTLILLGMLIVTVGGALRIVGTPGRHRRASDWIDLDGGSSAW